MSTTIPVQFPPGEILDRDGFVWVTLPSGTGISQSRILGVCSGDPLDLRLAQVTVERGDWRLDLLSPDQPASFPIGAGFSIAVPGLEQHDVRAWSTGVDVEARLRPVPALRRQASVRPCPAVRLRVEAAVVSQIGPRYSGGLEVRTMICLGRNDHVHVD